MQQSNINSIDALPSYPFYVFPVSLGIMWNRIILLFFLGTALAAGDTTWRQGQEYQYLIRSRTLTALEKISNQYTGILVKGLLTIQRKDEGTLRGRVSEAKYAQIHTDLPDGWDSRIPDEKLELRDMPLSSGPFEIKMKGGVVVDLVVDKNTPTWELNVLKSIVSQLQVDTQGENAKWSKINQVPEDDNSPYAMFRAMEDTVSGKCEVLYDIAPLPEETLLVHPELVPIPSLDSNRRFIEVVKTKNYEKCEQRMGYHFGITGKTRWEPGANDNGHFLSKSSTSRIVISGTLKSFTIQSSVSTNKMYVSPKLNDHQSGIVASIMNLTLIRVNEHPQAIGSPQNPQSTGNLVYIYNDPFSETGSIKSRKPTVSQGARGVSKRSNSPSSSEEGLQYASSGSSSSESAGSISYEERDYWQPKPKLDEAPDNPLLPYFIGYGGKAIRMAENFNTVQETRKLIAQISEELQNPDNIPKSYTLNKFTILSSLIRTMSRKEIQEVENVVPIPKEGQDLGDTSKALAAWIAFRDAVAQAGTGPALLTIKDWILKGKVRGMEAAGILAHLPDVVRTPTVEYVDEFFSLIKSPQVADVDTLKASALLAFTNLVHESQINNRSIHNRYPVHSFGRMSPKQSENVFSNYIPYLADKLSQAVKDHNGPEIQIYSIALGNIGHPKILGIFEPYIEGKEQITDFQRLVMVTSLGRLADLYPRVVRPIFFKIYLNTLEHHEIRCAAVMLLMKTKPTLGMFLRMAEFTRHDTNKNVNSAVISSIRNVARLQQDEYRDLARNARIASNLLSNKYYSDRYSHFMMKDSVDPQWNLAYWLGVSYLGSDDSAWMRDLYVALERSIGGFKVQTTQMSFMVSSIKHFFSNMEMWEYDEGRSLAEQVSKILNIKPEHVDQLEGHVSSNNVLFAFNSSIFDTIPRLFPAISKVLSKGFELDKKKFINSEVTVAFPTETGLPFLYTLEVPQLNSFAGKLKVDGKLNSNIQVKAEGRISVSKSIQGQIGFITPFDHQHYVAGVDMNSHYSLPGKIDVNLNVPQKRFSVTLRPYDESKFNLLHCSVVPYTAKHDILNLKPIRLDENTHEVHTQEPTKMPFAFEPSNALSFAVDVELDKVHPRISDFSDPLQNYIFSWFRNDGTYSKVEVYAKNTVNDNEAATLTVVYDYVYDAKSNQPNANADHKTDVFKISDKNPDSQTRRKAMMEKTARGVNSPKSYVVDAAWSLGKSLKGLLTFAHSRNPTDELHQSLLYFYHTYPGDKRDFEFCTATYLRSPYTRNLDYEKVVNMDVARKFDAIVRYGKECSAGPEVDITSQCIRTEERKQYVESLPIVKRCREEIKAGNKYLEACQDASYAAALRDAFNVTVRLGKGAQPVKTLASVILGVVKGMAFPNVIVGLGNSLHTDENQIDIRGKMTPDLQKITVGVYSPNMETYFPNMDIDKSFFDDPISAPYYRGQQSKKVGYYSDEDYCVLDTNKVMTFDRKTYPVKLDKCSHVALTTYPTENPNSNGQYVPIPEHMRVTVLVSETGDNKKEVKIGFGEEEILVLPSGQNPEVFVGGKKIKYSKEQAYYHQKSGETDPVFEVYELPDGSVELSSEKYDVDIIYKPENVQIRASDKYRHAVRGLCGNYDSQPENDFLIPKNCIMTKPEVFIASYALTQKNCKGPSLKYAKDIPNTMCVKHEYKYSNVISDREAGRWPILEGSNWGHHVRGQKTPEECNTYRTQVIDQDNQVCFTTRPVPSCGRGCNADQTKPKKYDLYCLPNDERAAALRRRIEQGASPDLSHKPVSTSRYIDVPVTCSRGV